MEHRKPGKHARDNEPTDENTGDIKAAAWAAVQARPGQVPAPRVSMELLERVAFLLRRC
jgi:hypothetical protein